MYSKREKIIRNYFNPQGSFDFEDLYNYLSPDVILYETEGLPWSGVYYGINGLGDFMAKVTRYIISEIKIEEIYSCGDQVVTIGKSIGRVVKTQRPFGIRVVQIFTFDDQDKIKKVVCLADLKAFQEILFGQLVTP